MKEESPENPKSSSRKSVAVGSIDLYTVQCVKCYKWRVIDTQEEYEEIRCNFSENPFKCSRKAGGSCEDPGDIEYDSSRTWVIDKPNLPKTPKGFKRSLVLRKDFSKLDAYYIASSGKKMRTRTEVAAFLESNPDLKEVVSIDQFSFHTPKVMEDTIPENEKKAAGGGGSAAEKKGNGGGGGSANKVKNQKDEA